MPEPSIPTTPARPVIPPDAPPKIVAFDWGGVLLQICRGFAEGCAAAGLPLRDGAADEDLYSVRKTLSVDYQIGRLDDAAFFSAVSAAMRGLYRPDEIAAIHDAWLLGEYPGVAALVARLHEGGVRTALLSNTNERHFARRERDFPTAGTLTHQLASHRLGLAKPDPAIYAAFEAAVGASGPEIVFFDDLPENIAAAAGLGWRAVLVDHRADTAAQMTAALRTVGIL